MDVTVGATDTGAGAVTKPVVVVRQSVDVVADMVDNTVYTVWQTGGALGAQKVVSTLVMLGVPLTIIVSAIGRVVQDKVGIGVAQDVVNTKLGVGVPGTVIGKVLQLSEGLAWCRQLSLLW